LQMVHINDEGRFLRQATKWDELPVAAHSLLERFVQARLLVSHGEREKRTLEVAHESLFEVWPWLAQWLNDSRDFLLWHKRFDAELDAWEQNGQSSAHLLRAAQLAEAKVWLETQPERLKQREIDFIKRSWRQSRRLVWSGVTLTVLVLTGLSSMLVYALAQKGVAEENAGVAEQRRVRAEQAERKADSRRKALSDSLVGLTINARAATRDPQKLDQAAAYCDACVSILNAAYYGEDRQDDELRKKLAEAYDGFAWVLLLQKGPEDSLTCAQLAVDYAPELQRLKVNLAHAYLLSGKIEEAKKTYRECSLFAQVVREDFSLFRDRQLCSKKVAENMDQIEEELFPSAPASKADAKKPERGSN
jgi:hypothetical protein